MTRDQVARRLGVHITTVRRYERKGRLHPKVNDHGVWLFDPEEVERLATTRNVASPSGAVAARVFRALYEGYSLQQIVMEYQLPPALVRGLYAEWKAMETPERAPSTLSALPNGENASLEAALRLVAASGSAPRPDRK
jgi:hypothetical protein